MPADEFIRRYGKPYNPAADDYDRSPFIADIKEGKNDPIYNAHSYHTKVPPRAIIPYILHYTEPGDIVLDPFCGSGMTGVAALLCEKPPQDILETVQAMNPGRKIKSGARRAILNDLSPAACHIAYNYCTPVDVDELKREFERIKAAVKDEFDWLYGTEHYEPALNLYDPQKPEVAARLKNPPAKSKNDHATELFKGPAPERKWELISREEVGRRMGPDALARSPLPKGVKQFVCIPAVIQYTIWSDVHRCEGMVNVSVGGSKVMRKAARGCGNAIVLWDAAVDVASGTVKNFFGCPHCSQQWKKTQIPRLHSVPVEVNIEFNGLRLSRGQVVPSAFRISRAPSAVELGRLNDIDRKGIPDDAPNPPIDKTRDMYVLCALHIRNVERLADFYTVRNFRALCILREAIHSAPQHIQPALWFAFTGVAVTSSKMNTHHFGGQARPRIGTLYFPSFAEEAAVSRLLSGKEKSQPRLFQFIRNACSTRHTASVQCGSASCLPIKDGTVDFIFADPPFGSNIFYADLSFLWEGWMGELTDRTEEAVVSRNTRTNRFLKTLDNYVDLIAASFREMFRVLKPGRWASVEFNNSDGRVFEAIKTAARSAGFEIVNMLFLDKDQKSFKQVKGAKGEENVVGHDVLFNLYKPGPKERPTVRTAVNGEFVHLVVDTIREHLRGLPERIKSDGSTYSDEHRTTPFLNTMLMNALIPRGVAVDRLNLPFIDALCTRYFRKIDNRWYLPDEAVGNGHGDSMLIQPSEVDVTDEVSAIDWLRRLLTAEPRMLGEIKPLWMRATVRLTGDLSTQLERILRQNFWLDRATNKWREPTHEERQRMDTSERDRIRHNADRLLSGAMKDMPEDAELCRWIGVLYAAAKAIEEEDAAIAGGAEEQTPEKALTIYRQIGSLFGRVLKEKVDPGAHATAARQVRMASLRVQQAEEAKPKPTAPKTLFDM